MEFIKKVSKCLVMNYESNHQIEKCHNFCYDDFFMVLYLKLKKKYEISILKKIYKLEMSLKNYYFR